MWFDVQAALKEIEGGSACDTRDTATNNACTAQIRARVADVADVATLVTSQKTAGQFAQLGEKPDVDAFEERGAIAEYNDGLTRADAEQMVARCQGYENVVAFKKPKRSEALMTTKKVRNTDGGFAITSDGLQFILSTIGDSASGKGAACSLLLSWIEETTTSIIGWTRCKHPRSLELQHAGHPAICQCKLTVSDNRKLLVNIA